MEKTRNASRAFAVRVAPTLAVFLICLVLTSMLYTKAIVDEDLDTTRELATLGRGIVDHVNDELSTKVVQQELLATQFQATNAGVSLDALAAYSVPLGDTIGVLSWVPKVNHAERSAFETKISDLYRSKLQKNLTITERIGGVLTTSAVRDTYFPVTLVAPLATNEAAVLFDLSSNPARKAALQAAQSSGATKVTARIQLVQDSGPPLSAVLMLSPVFTTPVTTPDSALNPRGPLLGYISSVFRLPTLLRPVIAQRAGGAFKFTVAVYDVTGMGGTRSTHHGGDAQHGHGAPNAGVFLHALRSDGQPVPEAAVPLGCRVYSDTVGVGGRTWEVELHVHLRSRHSVRTGNPTTLLAVSLLVTVLLTLFLFQTFENHRRTLRRRHSRAQEREKAVAGEAARRAHMLTLGYACHELRNPLHVIGACCAELRVAAAEGTIPWLEELGDIATAGVHMKAIVDDILDLDKLREGKLDIVARPMQLRRVVAASVAQYHHISQVPVRAEVHPSVPSWLQLDPARVRQVLNNGLSNAAKYTTTGEIVVTVAVEDRSLVLVPPATEGEGEGEEKEEGTSSRHSRRRGNLSAILPSLAGSRKNGGNKSEQENSGSGTGGDTSGAAAETKTAAAAEHTQGEHNRGTSAAEGGEEEKEAGGGQRLMLRLEVVDTGVGFGDTDPDTLFEDFAQGSIESHTSLTSTGLGLGTCRKLVALMGGQVGLRREGERTHFWVLLPARQLASPLTTPASYRRGLSTSNASPWASPSTTPSSAAAAVAVTAPATVAPANTGVGTVSLIAAPTLMISAAAASNTGETPVSASVQAVVTPLPPTPCLPAVTARVEGNPNSCLEPETHIPSVTAAPVIPRPEPSASDHGNTSNATGSSITSMPRPSLPLGSFAASQSSAANEGAAALASAAARGGSTSMRRSTAASSRRTRRNPDARRASMRAARTTGKAGLRAGTRRPPRRSKSAAALPIASLGLHVLVVDDEAVNRRLACRMLQRLGCSSHAVDDGDQVLSALEAASAADAPFTVVMSDINMQRVGGEGVARAVQAHPQYKHLPLLAVTGNTSKSDIDHYTSLGFLSVLPKPFTIEEMQSSLSPLRGNPNSPPASPHAGQATAMFSSLPPVAPSNTAQH